MHRIPFIFGVLILHLLVAGCADGQTVRPIAQDEAMLLQEFQKFDAANKVKLTEDGEPGERLLLCITLVDKQTKKALGGQKIQFFHTDTTGEYSPRVAGDESTARLSGTTVADAEGRVFVETTMPGAYGSSASNRHIHTTIFGARPEGYDINFRQYSSFMGRRFSNSSDQHFMADLKRGTDGSLVVFITMEAKFRRLD
ncbi:MAG: hypothetical protein WBO10_00340 [Pyrinomonadaceae bacterium]